ncbi:ArsR/SmtB family transcription factor [Gracilimonas mengyeensis]|uniref:Transcriptional regulator, ArsR family n=1 Tax=Gracilimonas mengyeensis TaxID=1302730 RepID=A0A521F1Y6_9BACT|nr:metalloregulator ArsR/SmtB family transcription factor [Gracilimonas mengyeensis]SMO90199.1 transcriptional regulator, ArsR family [Gracilimonas mengyeensis]
MKAREFKKKIYNELAVTTKAIANPNRLRIIELLAQGASTVEYIAEQTGLSVANASQHLQTLKNARLVSSEKEGKYSIYRLAGPRVFEAWSALRELGLSQNAEISRLMDDYRNEHETLEMVSVEELVKRVDKDEVFLVDVRPRHEYEAGHILSATSFPRDEIRQHIKNLPKNKDIIAYCRGPLCAMADDVVSLLRRQGFNAKRLELGYPEWKANGLPVEESA